MQTLIEVGDLWVLSLAAREWLLDHPTNPNREEVAKALLATEGVIKTAQRGGR